LVAKSILRPAIRTGPGDGIAGHPPHVLLHATLTDAKPAAAHPAKRKRHSTAIAMVGSGATLFLPFEAG